MSEIEQNLEGTEKAGNYDKIVGRLTFIDWDRRTITHNYHINTYDADGDLLKEGESGRVTFNGDQFDYWINQEMKDETLRMILEDYNSKLANG